MTSQSRTVIAVNGHVVAGEAPAPRPIETTVTVNGEPVDHQAIARETQNHGAPRGKPAAAWQKAADAVAIRALLLQEARRLELAPEPAEVAPGRFETEEDALIRSLVEAAVTVSAPSGAAIRAEWERDPTRFRSPPLWEASHILVRCDPRDVETRDAARARASDIAALVKAGTESFARLAQRHSDCGSKSTGGALGHLRPGDTVPEFEAVLSKLGEGEITPEPVLTRHGWHIIKMDACADGDELPFEAARTKVSEAMEKVAWAKAAREFIDRLVAAANITGALKQTASGARDAG